MATAAEIQEIRGANTAIETLALRSLHGFWASLDLTRPEAARDALVQFVPALTAQYGDVAALFAADWYDELRTAAGARGRFAAVMADPFPAEYIEQRVRFGAAHLFTDAPQEMVPFLDGMTSEYTLQPGRDTIQQASAADPAATGWHRETRAGGCEFCRLLAGRGGVYKQATVRFAAHDDCHCVGVPSWDADAEEVPVAAYVASERTSRMTPRERDAHNRELRRYMAALDD